MYIHNLYYISLSLSIYIYINIYIHLSLSLYIYIYIYILRRHHGEARHCVGGGAAEARATFCERFEPKLIV